MRSPLARVALIVLIIAAGAVWSVSPARAHTQLDASEPAAGATAEGPTDRVELTFSRPIELLQRSVRVVGHPGRVADITLSGDGTVVTATLDPPLTDGSYDIAWRVLASDSHPREGDFTFSVSGAPDSSTGDDGAEPASPGAAGEPGGAAGTTDPDPERPDRVDLSATFETLANLFRIAMYLGLMIAAGLALFKAWPHRGQREGAPQLAGWTSVAAGVALVASAGEVATHVATVSGSGFAGFVDPGTWRAVLRTGLGTAFWVRSAGLVLLVVGGERRRRRALASAPDALKLVGALLVLGSFQFVGHTASATPVWAVRTSDAVHAIAAAVWVGGIVGLALLSHHGVHEGRRIAAVRFSTAATYAVVAVGLAGLALAAVNLPTLDALWDTGYGQILVAKLALVGLLGAVGGYNHLRVVPAVTDGDDDALARLRHTVAAEAAMIVLVLALTALLVNQSPT